MNSVEHFTPDNRQFPCNPSASPRLRVLPVVVVLGVYIAIQFAVGLITGAVAVLAAMKSGLDIKDPQVLAQATQSAMAPGTVVGMAFSGAAGIGLSILWFKGDVKDRSTTGGAWGVGSLKAICAGLGIGMLVAVSYLGISPLIIEAPESGGVGPLAKMAAQPGAQQTVWILLALLLAPPIEELLFRGVLFGGICRSWGAVWAAILTTAVFILLHVNEMMHYWPAFVFVTAMAAAALTLRLRTGAIVPSIAAHFGYNLILVCTVVLTTR